MPKIVAALTAIEAKRLAKPGLNAVGTVAGLMLSISGATLSARSWILRTTGRRQAQRPGLGPCPAMSLADAIARARETLAVIRLGVDPVSERRSKQAPIKWTFNRCALAYIAGHKDGSKNAKRVQQCENTLTTYAFPTMGGKNVRDDQLPL